MFAQAPKLFAMLALSGDSILETSNDRKKEECDKLDRIELQLGPAGLAKMIECGGDFPMAFKHAKAFCATGRATGDDSKVTPSAEGVHLNEGSCDVSSQPGSNGHRSLHLPADGTGSDGEKMCDAVCTKAKAQVYLCMLLYV